MKTKILAIAGLATALVGGGAFFAGNALASPPPERHPEMRKAMRQLRAALATMQNAAWDFHGHKTDAMNATKRAIAEVQKGIDSDRH